MELVWWHWIVGGVVLILAELAIPAFFIIWFGMGAVLVGLLLLLAPGLSLTVQAGLWLLASLLMVGLWVRIFKKDAYKTRVGLAEGEVLGEVGLAVQAVGEFSKGKVRFQRPVLGSDEWTCLADTPIAAGERVVVVAVEGGFLKVRRA